MAGTALSLTLLASKEAPPDGSCTKALIAKSLCRMTHAATGNHGKKNFC